MATTSRNGHKGRQRSAVRQVKAAAQPKRRRGATNGGSSTKTTKPTKPTKATASPRSPAKRAKAAGEGEREAGGARQAVKRGTDKVLHRLEAPLPKPGALVRRAAERVIARAGERAQERSGELAREAGGRLLDSARQAWQNARRRRLPIQRSLDIAAPLRVVWDEFSALEFLPEGVATVTEIERDGDGLRGALAGADGAGWEAEILDERPYQSFAWQSHAGTDCAGLITFHALAERLTRLEVNLDVVATGAAEAVKLATRLADRRADADLRRFKARVELINPDTYEQEPDDEDQNEHSGQEQRAEA
jgi:uncharacterized membrane protein